MLESSLVCLPDVFDIVVADGLPKWVKQDQQWQPDASQLYPENIGGDERLNSNGHAKSRHRRCRGQRQPAGDQHPIPLNSRHETMRIHHQDADGDQHRGQTDAKGHNQQQSKADPIQRQGAEEHHKSRGTGHNAAGHTQRQQFTERDC